MANLNDLYTVKDIVEQILWMNTDARENDMILYKEVCRKMNPDFLNLSFGDAMDKALAMGMPTTESVRRCRQKLQHEAPLFFGSHSRRCNVARAKKQKEYREFARS